jgi:hypothetical protein
MKLLKSLLLKSILIVTFFGCQHLSKETIQKPTVIEGLKQTNKSSVYDKVAQDKEIKKLSECACITLFTRDISSTSPRTNIRDTLDSIAVKYISNKEKRHKLLFWGSGDLLNEATIVLRLLEEGVDIDITLYDINLIFYKYKDDPKGLDKIAQLWADDNSKIPALLRSFHYDVFKEPTKKNIIEYAKKTINIVKHFKSIVERHGHFKGSLHTVSDPSILSQGRYDVAFAIDSFIRHPGQLHEQAHASKYILLHKYDSFGNPVRDENSGASIEVWEKSYSKTSQTYKRLYKEYWKKDLLNTKENFYIRLINEQP